MGDRIAIAFRNRVDIGNGKFQEEISPVLFSHWDGKDFLEIAVGYAKELIRETQGKNMMPLDRREPGTVLLDFIVKYFKDQPGVKSSYYLCRWPAEGDCSDNGYWIIDLQTDKAEEGDESAGPNSRTEDGPAPPAD
jgi:hypothetical protein